MVTTALLAAAAAVATSAFTLAAPGVRAQIWIEPDEPAYVRKAAQDLIGDVEKIAGAAAAPTFAASFEGCAAPCVVLASASVKASAARLPAAQAARLNGKWEAYEVGVSEDGRRLVIAGSDPRGTMFGLYAFIERQLGVDPLYFWTGREPVARATLAWPSAAALRMAAGEPSVRYRGWFINDEDLLTEWKDGGGRRDLDYPYYHQVVAADVADRVFEAMVRLQMNLVIPASFIDILNPPEAALVETARARGLYLSMHHVEPMGVSGFTFQNYWKKRGKTPRFSFYSARPELEEVWRVYAAAWAKQPDVIWQIGLRGIADRPMWLADPSIPQSDAERGRLISEAMATQMRIIAEVDPRPAPPVTTTLWAEGAFMQAEGYLKIPAGVTVVFSDNSPGWKLQRDFYDTPREAGRAYGVYYHHQLWSAGPHLVQAVPPAKTHEILSAALARGAGSYAILNVGNVREFALGLDASARMLRDLPAFEPERFVDGWCAERFGGGAVPDAAKSGSGANGGGANGGAAVRDDTAARASHASAVPLTGAARSACDAYRALFASYAISAETKTPLLMDGQTIAAGLRALERMERHRTGTAAPVPTAEQRASADWGARALSDTNAASRMDTASLLAAAKTQREKLDEAVRLAATAQAALRAAAEREANADVDAGAARYHEAGASPNASASSVTAAHPSADRRANGGGPPRGSAHAIARARATAGGVRTSAAGSADASAAFFDANLVAQVGLHRGLTAWLEQMLEASLAQERGDTAGAIAALVAGRDALRGMREAQQLAMRGRFADWYRGDKKMRLTRAEEATDKLLAALRQPAPSRAARADVGEVDADEADASEAATVQAPARSRAPVACFASAREPQAAGVPNAMGRCGR